MANWFSGGCRVARVPVTSLEGRAAGAVELEVHHPLDLVLRHARRGRGQLGALDQGGPEQVLLGALLVAGHQRLVGDVGIGVLLITGERGELRLVGLRGLPVDRLVRWCALPGRGRARRRRRRWCGRQLRGRPPVAGRAGARRSRRRLGARRRGPRRGRLRRRGDGRGHRLGGVHGPEPQHGGLPDQPDELVLLDVGHADDDLPVAGGRHLGLADAEAVDARLDDRPGQLQAVRIDLARAVGVLGGQGDRGATLQVETQLGRPVVRDRHQAVQRGHDDAEDDQGAAGMAASIRHQASVLVLGLVPEGRVVGDGAVVLGAVVLGGGRTGWAGRPHRSAAARRHPARRSRRRPRRRSRSAR